MTTWKRRAAEHFLNAEKAADEAIKGLEYIKRRLHKHDRDTVFPAATLADMYEALHKILNQAAMANGICLQRGGE